MLIYDMLYQGAKRSRLLGSSSPQIRLAAAPISTAATGAAAAAAVPPTKKVMWEGVHGARRICADDRGLPNLLQRTTLPADSAAAVDLGTRAGTTIGWTGAAEKHLMDELIDWSVDGVVS